MAYVWMIWTYWQHLPQAQQTVLAGAIATALTRYVKSEFPDLGGRRVHQVLAGIVAALAMFAGLLDSMSGAGLFASGGAIATLSIWLGAFLGAIGINEVAKHATSSASGAADAAPAGDSQPAEEDTANVGTDTAGTDTVGTDTAGTSATDTRSADKQSADSGSVASGA